MMSTAWQESMGDTQGKGPFCPGWGFGKVADGEATRLRSGFTPEGSKLKMLSAGRAGVLGGRASALALSLSQLPTGKQQSQVSMA